MKEIKIDLLPLIHKLEAVLKRGFSRDLLAGNYQSVFKGKGMEFVGFREYDPADDAMMIDWRASLRAHHPIVRVNQEERNINVLFIMDVSDSMLFSSHKKLKCEYAAELVGTLAFAMHEVGDHVGILLFSDKVIDLILPSTGRNQFYKIVKSLSNPKNYGGKYNLVFALNYLLNLKHIRSDSIVFLISDYIGLTGNWRELIKLIGLKYDLTAIVIRDPVDMKLPEIGAEIHFRGPFSNENILVNPLEARARYEIESRNQIERLEKELKKTQSTLLMLTTEKGFTDAIFTYFAQRLRFKG